MAKSKITYSISSSFQETSGILGSAHERKKTASMNNSSHGHNKIREHYSFLKNIYESTTIHTNLHGV